MCNTAHIFVRKKDVINRQTHTNTNYTVVYVDKAYVGCGQQKRTASTARYTQMRRNPRYICGTNERSFSFSRI